MQVLKYIINSLYSLALLAHVFALALRLDLGGALVAEGAALVLDEALVGQLLVAHLAGEALRVPRRVHRLDHPPHDELACKHIWISDRWEFILNMNCGPKK